MTITLDRYGILIDGNARQGFLQITHPTFQQPLRVQRTEDYTGPEPLLTNLLTITCHNTFTGRMRMLYQFARWLFTDFSNVNKTPSRSDSE